MKKAISLFLVLTTIFCTMSLTSFNVGAELPTTKEYVKTVKQTNYEKLKISGSEYYVDCCETKATTTIITEDDNGLYLYFINGKNPNKFTRTNLSKAIKKAIGAKGSYNFATAGVLSKGKTFYISGLYQTSNSGYTYIVSTKDGKNFKKVKTYKNGWIEGSAAVGLYKHKNNYIFIANQHPNAKKNFNYFVSKDLKNWSKKTIYTNKIPEMKDKYISSANAIQKVFSTPQGLVIMINTPVEWESEHFYVYTKDFKTHKIASFYKGLTNLTIKASQKQMVFVDNKSYEGIDIYTGRSLDEEGKIRLSYTNEEYGGVWQTFRFMREQFETETGYTMSLFVERTENDKANGRLFVTTNTGETFEQYKTNLLASKMEFFGSVWEDEGVKIDLEYAIYKGKYFVVSKSGFAEYTKIKLKSNAMCAVLVNDSEMLLIGSKGAQKISLKNLKKAAK